MTKRNKNEWLALLQAQKISGLNQKQFCKEQGVNPKSFSYYKKQFSGGSESSDGSRKFVKLNRASISKASTGTIVIVRSQGVELELSFATAPFIAELIQCLK